MKNQLEIRWYTQQTNLKNFGKGKFIECNYIETNEPYLETIDIESIITDFKNLTKLNKIPNKIFKIIENNSSINLNERKSNKKKKNKIYRNK